LIDAKRHADAVADLLDDDDDVSMAAVTLAELLVGVELADSRRRAQRERYVADLVATIAVDDYDSGVARAHARLLAHARRVGRPRGAHDLIVAATALERARMVVTADVGGFAGLPDLAVRTL
jgi:tRNA(fMet)-specific endonuclease VapC